MRLYEPVHQTCGKLALIEQVTHQQHITVRRVRTQQVLTSHLQRNRVGRSVELDCLNREDIYVGSKYVACACFHGSNANKAGPRSKIDNLLAGNSIRCIQNIPRKRLSARPGERPERWWQTHLTQLLFRLLPYRNGLVSEVQRNFRHQRHRH
jgi:hypothetical protein